MADWAKIAIKTGLIVGIMTAIWALFTQIPIPSLNFSYITQFGSKALAILYYWIPAFEIVWNITLVTLGVYLGLWGFRFAQIAVRWLFKVNE